MEKRSSNVRSSKRKYNSVENIIASVIPSPPSSVVGLTLLKDLQLTIMGKVTGRKYFFPGAGSTIYDIDEQDANIMMRKYGSRSCCTGVAASPYFELA